MQELITTDEAQPGLLPHAAITEAQQIIISQRTPREDVRYRQGKGGKELAYVDHAYVTRLLNEAFGWNWDFEVDNEEILYVGEQRRPFEVRCRGKLTVRTPTGQQIVKMQFGSQPIEMLRDQSAPVSLGDAFKGSASDALKKCASLLGIALDLYDSDSDVNQKPQQRQERPASYQQPAPQTQTRPTTNKTPQNPPRAEPKTPEEAEKRFYARFSQDIGGSDWSNVQAFLMSRAPKPTTVEGWIAVAEAIRDRIKGQTQPAA